MAWELEQMPKQMPVTQGVYNRCLSLKGSSLGSNAETWRSRLEMLRKKHFFGRFLAATRQRLVEVAQRLGLRRVPNYCGCPAP